MENYQERVKIEGTTDLDIAKKLADLAGFPEGSSVGRVNNIYHRELNPTCVYCFHKETLDQVGDDNPFLLGPDFIVVQVQERPKGMPTFQPTDEYLIDSNNKAPKSLLSALGN